MVLPFTKMQGAGNDYLYVRDASSPTFSYSEAAKVLSRRHYSVGADGLVVLSPTKEADIAMRIFNADGSEAAVCGNALRCAARLFFEDRQPLSKTVRILCGDGKIRDVKVHEKNGAVIGAEADMGEASLCRRYTLLHEGRRYEVDEIDMGNRHTVFFGSVGEEEFFSLGNAIARERKENQTNAEFATLLSRKAIAMRVYEKGSGETLSCASGACATAYAAYLRGECDGGEEIAVSCKGGILTVVCRPDGHIIQKGDAVRVFEGCAKLSEVTL